MDEAKKLRLALEHERGKGGGTGRRGFSQALPARVVEYLHRERQRGKTVEELVETSGLSRPTVYAWMGSGTARRPGPAFRQVRVVPAHAGLLGTGGGHVPPEIDDSRIAEATRRVVVMGRGKVAVVGLSVGEVAELFRRLGC